MDIWIITAWGDSNELMNSVMCLLFNKELVMPKVMELFDVDPQIITIRVETWYRDHDEDDASFYDWETYSRGEMKEGI